ncbi:MAG: DnaJ domain-containing protein [Acidobacteriota bacterium]
MAEPSSHRDFYSILGVSRTASPKDIKARFRELAREGHPDRFQGAEKQRAELAFQEITEAFNVLNDPVRRRQLDLVLAKPQAARHDPADLLRVYLNRGIRAYKKGDYLEAANNFDRATQTNAESPQAWHHLALTCLKEKRWLERAQSAIERAIALRPDHAPYAKLAGRIHAESGAPAKARQYYNRALKIGGPDPAVAKALQQLGGGDPTARPATAEDAGEGDRAGLFRKIF